MIAGAGFFFMKIARARRQIISSARVWELPGLESNETRHVDQLIPVQNKKPPSPPRQWKGQPGMASAISVRPTRNGLLLAAAKERHNASPEYLQGDQNTQQPGDDALQDDAARTGVQITKDG